MVVIHHDLLNILNVTILFQDPADTIMNIYILFRKWLPKSHTEILRVETC